MSSNPALTGSEISAIPEPEPHSPPAGDWHDDDGRALDSYFEAMPLGPMAEYLVRAMQQFINPPTKGSRLLRNRINAPSGQQHAVMALPADADRVYLNITDVTAKGFYIHSEAFTVVDEATTIPSQTAAAFVPPGALPTRLEMNGYTGPVWVAGSFANGAIIEILSVTA